MPATDREFESACRNHLDRFFAAHPNAAIQKRALKALRLLRASEKPLAGKAEGILYAVSTHGRIPCGVPTLLNSEFEQFMGVTMSTVRRRAARVRELLTF